MPVNGHGAPPNSASPRLKCAPLHKVVIDSMTYSRQHTGKASKKRCTRQKYSFGHSWTGTCTWLMTSAATSACNREENISAIMYAYCHCHTHTLEADFIHRLSKVSRGSVCRFHVETESTNAREWTWCAHTKASKSPRLMRASAPHQTGQ